MRITVENPAEMIPLISELMAANWDETGFDFPFRPDVAAYDHCFKSGLIFALVAWDGDEVVGYCTVVVTPHMHNPAVVMGANDGLFVHPDRRHTSLGGRLILAAEREAKARGATRFLWHCRAGTQLAAVLELHGCTPVDVVVMKDMSNGN